MKKSLMMLCALLMGMCWSCSKENMEPPVEPEEPQYVNPWINPTDTVWVDGKAYFKGTKPGYYDVILTRITGLRNSLPGTRVYSMTDYRENSFGFNFDGEYCDPRTEPERYVRWFVDKVQGRPRDRQLPYDAELAQMPTFPMYFNLSLDGVTLMDIVTDTDFNASHPAGSSLNDVCRVEIRGSMKPVVDLFKNWKPEYLMPEDYEYPALYSDWLYTFLSQTAYSARVSEIDYDRMQMLYEGCYIYVEAFPTQAGDYPVTVTVKVSSGATLTYRQTLLYRNF